MAGFIERWGSVCEMDGDRCICVDEIDSIFVNHINPHDHIAITLFDHKVYSELGWTQKSGNCYPWMQSYARDNSTLERH